nr:MAG TPA: hypothetical protein [Caudoviricetes sp.]
MFYIFYSRLFECETKINFYACRENRWLRWLRWLPTFANRMVKPNVW